MLYYLNHIKKKRDVLLKLVLIGIYTYCYFVLTCVLFSHVDDTNLYAVRYYRW